MTTDSVTRFRRRSSGVSLILFPLSMLGAALAQPALGDKPAQVYDVAAAHPGRIAASVAIGLPGVALWVVGIVGAVHLVRRRGAVLSHIGGGLALLGAVAHAMMATLLLVLLALPRAGDRSQLVPAVDRIASHVFPVAMPLLALGGIGVLLLAFALRRAGQVSRGVPVLVLLGFISEFVPWPGTTGDVVLWLFVGAGLGLVGRRVLTMADVDWTDPQEIDSGVPVLQPAVAQAT
ncbi:MAG: hypothetical protein ABR549_01670 [Mycobacteriales bacterium]